jgi:pimeloyl-ACP methyl ester carboxylesterase
MREELVMHISMRSRIFMLVLACAGLAVVSAPASAQTHYAAAIGPGSFYEIDIPEVWNGDLVLYAHGIVQADEPVAPPTMQDGYAQLRAALLASGYAVAASSYSSNGWSLADAVRRTHQLSSIFTSKAGVPRRRLLVGHSMGALAIVKLAEEHAGQYDGVLAMCGPLGGALRELQYAGDARVTFDYYFPGVLPGTAFAVPPGTQYLSPFDPGGPSELFLRVYAALSANPAATLQWATAAGLPFNDATELGSSALYVVGFVLRYTNDFIERVHGKIPYDNSETRYQVNVTPDPQTNAYLSALLNAGVERFDADRAAVNYYEHNYTPSGQIGIPVITLHTERDAAIPYQHEDLFAAKIAAAGQSDLLVQRPIDRWGHCAFTPEEIQTAFGDLARWVETGTRP